MLEPPDTFHLSAAIGWLELGNALEANEELKKISEPLRATSEVLSAQLSIYFGLEDWGKSDRTARALIELQPAIPSHWTNLAYAARRKPKGGLDEAKEILLKAAALFPRESLVCYNLACYESQLGDLAQAKEWFEKSCAVGNEEQIRQMALLDPDLEPLRKTGGFSL